jgi:quinol monooxygenase YgiN
MIMVTGIFITTTENRDEVITAMMLFSEASRQVPGCLTLGFYADLEDANAIRIYGTWESAESNTAQVESSHFKAVWEVFDAHGVTAKNVGRYTIKPLTDDA